MSTELQFVVNVVAIVLGPIVAVAITLGYQKHKEQRDSKIRLFLTLMAHRKSFPPAFAWAESLNLIDVVFVKHPIILQRWHEYYDLLNQEMKDYSKRDHKYLELLSEIARTLGYSKLQQTDIDKFYLPHAHGNQAELSSKIQTELLRVLANTQALAVLPKQDNQGT